MSDRLRVNEIFYSIQGESTRVGRPCVFVRLTGCNLRCVWCDTEYAFYDGRQMAIAEIVDQVRSYGCELVEVTGGEPMLQKGIHALLRALLDDNRTVMIETSGERDLSGVDQRIIKIMDLKCPGSGELARNRWSNLDCLTPRDEVKFVLADRRDYEWARAVIAERGIAARVNAILMSPVFGLLKPATLASWILEDRIPVTMQLQMHKQIWDPSARGV
ncbi:MAG TPA: radical SAM protein [Candidatus Binataceae bacterium]|nr:radical SAM protein [Candidatus Binataceae bacterium]